MSRTFLFLRFSSRVTGISVFLVFITFIAAPIMAMDLDWTGVYRVEGYHIVNSELSGQNRQKEFALHHLILKPKIVAGDGLTIYSRFDLFNSGSGWLAGNSQTGQVFGSGISNGNTPINQNNSNALSQRQKSETLEVTQLYLTYAQEHGALVVGRTPIQFGLGISHHAGNGLFDHWYDTRDLIGYKIVMGNFYFLPMLAKIKEGDLGRSDDISEYLFHLQYENVEVDLEMGIFHAVRKSSQSGNDTPLGSAPGEAIGGAGGTYDKMDLQSTNFYAVRNREEMRLGAEVSFQSGRPGVQTAAGDRVSVSGFGLATEFEYRPSNKKIQYGFKAGIASGDDPSTDSRYEGFIFDKNYDVAFLMFNHPLGQKDFFRTSLAGTGAGNVPVEGADNEAISNAVYMAPYFKYLLNDNWDLKVTLITGYLNHDPLLNVKSKSDLGYELDLKLAYTPRKGVVWQTDLGLLHPGEAFKGDGSLKNNFAYGISTKAAISF